MTVDKRPSKRVYAKHDAKSRTQQAHTEASDINVMIRKHTRGDPILGTGKTPTYGDFSTGLSFHESLIRIQGAQEDFDALPAAVRDACANDPGNFLDQVMAPEGRAFLETHGLIPERAPKAAPPAVPAPAADPPPEVPAEG